MPLTPSQEQELRRAAASVRISILDMLYRAQSGHPGGSLSCVEIVSLLFLKTMRFDPQHPNDPERDRFILSKGHACPTLYALYAHLGLISAEELQTLRKPQSRLQGHPDMQKLPFLEMSAGPLGLGLSAGLGMALCARLDQKKYHCYVLLGDGELQEGSVWEAAMAAAKFGTNNLIAIVDRNGVQLDGATDEVMPLGDLAAKFTSFGWKALRADGHSFASLEKVFDAARQDSQGPTVVLASTVKGKGVSFMEGRHEWHGQPIDESHYERARCELLVEMEAVSRG